MRIAKAREKISGLSAPKQKRLKAFCKDLSTDRDPKLFDDEMDDVLRMIVINQEWFEQEKKYLAALGFNQSKYVYKSIESQIYAFCGKHVEYNGWIDHFKSAKAEMISEMKEWKLHALDYFGNDDIQEWIPRDEAHAGWSFIETGLREKGMYRENLLQNYSEKVREAKSNKSFNTIILPGTRTQTSPPYDATNGDKTFKYVEKSRLVSMIDLYNVLGETVFAGPCQEKMATVDWYAGGKNDRETYNVILKFKEKHRVMWITLDYSKYDQSIPGWLIYEGFDVIEAAFDKSHGFDEELWRIVKDDFVHKVFLLGNGKVVEAHDGVPSGSMFTQIMDTIVNRLMILTYLHAKSIDTCDISMIIMGDDNLIFSSVELDSDDIAGYLMRNFGVKVNPSKSSQGSIDDAPEFLSRHWTDRGVYRVPAILLAKLLYPENFRKYDKSDKRACRKQVYMILSCFIHDFPLGMKWIDKTKIDTFSMEELSKAEHIQFTTGLMRYRLQTLGSKQYAA